MIAAIGSFCDARARGGSWHVRIDDIDTPRIVDGIAGEILRTLEAFSLEWDGCPVYQSRHRDAYHQALHLLRAEGHVFACSCSRKEVSKAAISGPAYPGTCRNGLGPGRIARSLRLRVENAARCSFGDALQGPISQDLASDVGDFVIYRSDGIFSYHLACVVDDAHQGITHVVRGADLIDSTPRQIHLQHLLGLSTPAYLHLPVATNHDGEKLSKQTRAAPVDTTRAGETIYGVLHFLGQQPPAELAHWSAHSAINWAVKAWRRDVLPDAHAIEMPIPYRSPARA